MNHKDALEILKEGHNVFLTGPAGTGKTYVLNQFIEHLRKSEVKVGVTASTGIAATHIEGQTIHSWSGMGVSEELTQKAINDLTKRLRLHVNFKDTRVLIIDEISMLHARQLDMVDRISRVFKGIRKPFGGMQVVLSGDFLQLPPVVRRGEEVRYAFEAKSWTDLDLRISYLTAQHRHTDWALKYVFEAIRNDAVDAEVHDILAGRIDAELDDDKPLKLYTHNVDVDTENQHWLEQLSTPEERYAMSSRGNPKLVEGLKRGCLAPEMLRIKEGAHVMFVKNKPGAGFVNGTRGVVVGYDKKKFPIVKVLKTNKRIVATPMSWTIHDEEGKVRAEITQVPLRLAWAVTVHKSQGLTLESAEIDLSRAFDYGLGYVALSRVESLEGIRIVNGLNDLALKVNERLVKYDQRLRELSESATTELEARSAEEKKKLHTRARTKLDENIPEPKSIEVAGSDFRLERISPSMVSTYLFCPRQFYYQYVKKIPLRWTSIALLFGQAIHKAVEIDRIGGNPLSAFLEIFAKNELSPDDRERFDEHVDLGERLLDEYENRKDQIALTYHIVAGGDAEQWLIRKITNPLTGEELEIPLSFKYDYLMPGGRLVEYKTSKRRWRTFDEKVLLQTGLYAMGLASELEEPLQEILYLVFVKDPHVADPIQVLSVEPTEEQMDAAFEITQDVLRDIKRGRFDRPERHWSGCQCLEQEAVLNAGDI